MENIIYHQVLPENDRDYGNSTDRALGFNEYSTLDFVLNADQSRGLLCGSVRIEYDLVVNKDSTTALTTEDIKIDNFVGGHAVLESCNTIFSSSGQVENLDQYGRFCKLVYATTSSEDDQHRSDALCELRSPSERATLYMLKQKKTKTSDSTLLINPDISIKPLICLNRPSSAGSVIDFSKVGSVRLQFNLARNVSVFHGLGAGFIGGGGASNQTNYVMKNVRCVFKSVPAQNQNVVLQKVLSMNQSLESSNASVNVSVPAVCSAMTGVFLTQSKENTYSENNFLLERPQNIGNIQMNYNDQSNIYQTFRLDNQEEILHNFLESMRSGGIHNASLNKLNGNDCFGIGINFKEMIDFTRNKFSLNIESGISSAVPVVLFMYFHSLIQV